MYDDITFMTVFAETLQQCKNEATFDVQINQGVCGILSRNQNIVHCKN